MPELTDPARGLLRGRRSRPGDGEPGNAPRTGVTPGITFVSRYSTVAGATLGRRSRTSPARATITPRTAITTVTPIAVW